MAIEEWAQEKVSPVSQVRTLIDNPGSEEYVNTFIQAALNG